MYFAFGYKKDEFACNKYYMCWYWCGWAVALKQVRPLLEANVLKMEYSRELSRSLTRILTKVKVIENPDWKTDLSVQRKSCSNHRKVNSYLQLLHEPLQSDFSDLIWKWCPLQDESCNFHSACNAWVIQAHCNFYQWISLSYCFWGLNESSHGQRRFFQPPLWSGGLKTLNSACTYALTSLRISHSCCRDCEQHWNDFHCSFIVLFKGWPFLWIWPAVARWVGRGAVYFYWIK